MNARFLILVLCLAAGTAMARDKLVSRPLLSEEDAIWLGGSSIAIVKHPLPKPRVQTITGAIFQNATGWMANADVRREAILSEPSNILERELATLLARQFGAVIVPQPLLVKGSGWAEVAAAPADAPYILDLRTTRLAIEFRKFQNQYWVGFGIRVALLERATARPMFVSNCYTDTVDHPGSPRLKDLEANELLLLGDVMASLAWKCLARIAGDLVPNPDAIPRPPRHLVDPLADFARANPRD